MATLVGWYLKSCCGSCMWLTSFLTFHIRHLYSSSSQVKSKPQSHSPSSVYLLPIHAVVAVFSLAAVKCSELHMDTPVVTNCSNPWGTFSYGSTCTFHCPEGQLLNGSSRATCQENGRWSAAMPTCQGTYFICFRTWPWPRRQNPCFFSTHFSWWLFFPSLPSLLAWRMFHNELQKIRCFIQSPRDEAGDCVVQTIPCHCFDVWNNFPHSYSLCLTRLDASNTLTKVLTRPLFTTCL